MNDPRISYTFEEVHCIYVHGSSEMEDNKSLSTICTFN